MSDEMLFIIFILTVVGILAVLIAKMASFLQDFAKDTKYICYEMDHAADYEEYRRWRGELRCHYLCLIPFVNGKNVMHLYNRIYHRADRKKKERKDSLFPLLLPSVLGISICMVCVCGMTWAWYTASVEMPAQKMTAAYYEVTVELVKTESGAEIEPTNDSYAFVANTTYTITLQAGGSVKECGGYCLIKCGDTKYYTQTFKPEQTITITLTPTESGAYTFTGVWGSVPSSVTETDIIKANTFLS